MATRLDRLSARRTDPLVTNARLYNEFYKGLSQSESVKYTVGAMQPIDEQYTRVTYEQGERVCNQLDKRLVTECSFEYQGSVTNDTHIKARSDIDVLLIIGKFFTLEHPQVPSHPYTGDPLQDLLDLRDEAWTVLDNAFPEATVKKGHKAISLEGGSLRRKIDVVPSNWFNTNQYAEKLDGVFRGVQILDAETKQRLRNTPFLHNAYIQIRDQDTSGGLRKAARLMKSLKYDTDAIELSSYDIVSLAYNIPVEWLNYPRGMELAILNSCHTYCHFLEGDAAARNSIVVPDGHRKVFADGHATLAGLQQLTAELGSLVNDVLHENQRSFRKLAEARLNF